MSSQISENNRRIAKNTIALYFRTFVTMLVGLYTGRVMLKAIGVDDYGINAVVGSVVAMSSIVTGTMTSAISRYLTYALGKGDISRLKIMFSTSVNAQLIMSIIITFILEIVGSWFLQTKANIPLCRVDAANWVLQCSIVTLVISLISSPYNALLVAHERMSIYAYTSIVEAVLKLIICFLVMFYGGDRLILLALLQVVVGVIMRVFYGWYCGKKFEEAEYKPKVFDKHLLKELTIFSGLNLMNNGAYVFATQGVNMLVNIFFGVVYNASRALALQINSAIQSFVGNFTMAFSPQLTKSYAAGDISYAIHLANKGTKFTWMMMYVFIVPVCMEAEMILKLWLGEVPYMADLFLRFAMFESLAVASGQNLFRLIQSDGRVRSYTVHAALTAGVIFPLVWLMYFLKAPVWIAYPIFIIDFLVLNIVRFYDLKKLMNFSIRQHFIECLWPCIIISITSFIVPLLVSLLMEEGLLRFFINTFVSFIWTCFCCVVFGLTNNEKTVFFDKINKIFGKIVIFKNDRNYR